MRDRKSNPEIDYATIPLDDLAAMFQGQEIKDTSGRDASILFARILSEIHRLKIGAGQIW